MTTKIVNLTGHEVTIKSKDGDLIILSSGKLRANYTTNELGTLDTQFGKIPLTKNFYHRIRKMPPPLEATYYLVSRLVAELYSERNDLLIVNGIIRDNGITIACRSLAKI